ncbi:MAG: hypothetical protein LC634_03715 [Sphingomonadales bacterium]|nr:hypothetical protein [Sphingomonadales bacterium]
MGDVVVGWLGVALAVLPGLPGEARLRPDEPVYRPCLYAGLGHQHLLDGDLAARVGPVLYVVARRDQRIARGRTRFGPVIAIDSSGVGSLLGEKTLDRAVVNHNIAPGDQRPSKATRYSKILNTAKEF